MNLHIYVKTQLVWWKCRHRTQVKLLANQLQQAFGQNVLTFRLLWEKPRDLQVTDSLDVPSILSAACKVLVIDHVSESERQGLHSYSIAFTLNIFLYSPLSHHTHTGLSSPLVVPLFAHYKSVSKVLSKFFFLNKADWLGHGVPDLSDVSFFYHLSCYFSSSKYLKTCPRDYLFLGT